MTSGHQITITPTPQHVAVTLNGEKLAESDRAVLLDETGLPTRYYLPVEDVRMDLLAPTTKTSYCPYKGRASYWLLRAGDRTAADAAWAYLDPLPECPRIKGHLCFYPEKVERIEVEKIP